MINREIKYERNLTGSYMKIPMGVYAGLDERLILRRKLPGVLSVEKAYVDGNGQYWYNISGKQSLDTYSHVREIGGEFVERLVVSICSELEIMEWNLIDMNCLMLDPELIFITNSNREFIFTLYPGTGSEIETEFRQMMEYLLTKINHKDALAVRTAYTIYEKTLEEGYSVMDIRNLIMQARLDETAKEQSRKEEAAPPPACPQRERKPREEKAEMKERGRKSARRLILSTEREKKGKKEAAGNRGQILVKEKLWKYLREQFGLPEMENIIKGYRRNKSDDELPVVYPKEEIPEPQEQIHPTVLLGGSADEPRGVLLYQGSEQLEDIHLAAKVSRIGFGKDADIRINKSTISQIHAKIDREGETYYIEDLNSTNGTFVNEEMLAYKERRPLKANDIVRFADIRYRFC